MSAPTRGAMRDRTPTVLPLNPLQSITALYVSIDVYIYLMAPRLWNLFHQLREAITDRLIAIQHPMYAPLPDRIARLHEASALITTSTPTAAQTAALLVVIIIQTASVILALHTQHQHTTTSRLRR